MIDIKIFSTMLFVLGLSLSPPTGEYTSSPINYNGVPITNTYYFQNEKKNSLQNNYNIILADNSNFETDESDIETDGSVESDIEMDTQFLVPPLPSESPENLPVGGFINLQSYSRSQFSRDVQTSPNVPIGPVEPSLNPDWFRPEKLIHSSPRLEIANYSIRDLFH